MTEPSNPASAGTEPTFHPAASAFVEAVAAQLARRAESPPTAVSRGVDDTARRLAAVLHAAERGAEEEAASLLEAEPLLLSSVFQNADLLYQQEYPAADAISMAVLHAIHRATEAQERAGEAR